MDLRACPQEVRRQCQRFAPECHVRSLQDIHLTDWTRHNMMVPYQFAPSRNSARFISPRKIVGINDDVASAGSAYIGRRQQRYHARQPVGPWHRIVI
jgi:hypothetical protein